MPQGMGHIGQGEYANVNAATGGMGAVLLWRVVGNTLRKVFAGRDEFCELEQAVPQCKVGFRQENRVLSMLSQVEELLPNLSGCLVLRPHDIKPLEAPEYWKELQGVTHTLAQHPRPRVSGAYFWGGPAFGRHECCDQGSGKGEFLLDAFGRSRQGCDQLQPLVQVHQCFHIRRALRRLLTGMLEVDDCLLGVATVTVVMRQGTVVLLQTVAVQGFKRLRRALVQDFTPLHQQGGVGYVVRQRMLEGILRVWKGWLLVEKLGRLQV